MNALKNESQSIRNNAKINIITSLLLQVLTIISGFVLPRIILSYFGSEINGLVSSITQFLGYISLLEGGITGVAMSALYRPLAENDSEKVSKIVQAAKKFFRRISTIFVVYTIVLGVLYPIIVQTSFSWGYVCSLTFILGLCTFIQYCFSLTYRSLLIADQKGFVVYISQMGFVVINLVLVFISLNYLPEIHFIKLIAAISYLIQPIVYNYYIKKHYNINYEVVEDKEALAQKWDGFGHNLAFFIHSNTDIVVLTFFSDLRTVSVYSIYSMVIKAIKNFVSAVSNAVTPTIGNLLVSLEEERKQKMFDQYELFIGMLTAFVFTVAAKMLVPLVLVYTKGVNDAQYNQPIFASLLLFSEAIYSFTDPYSNIAYVAGHFKQTAKYAYIEASINIFVSIMLVRKYGLIGVAIGTVIAMIYRMLAQILYLRKNIIFRRLKDSIRSVLIVFFASAMCFIIYEFIPHFSITTYLSWIVEASIFSVICMIILLVTCFLFRKADLLDLVQLLKKRLK